MLTASEVDKGNKSLDAFKTTALIINELQHVTVSFQQSRASLLSKLPPEILQKGMTQSSLFKNQEMQELTGQKWDWEFTFLLPHVY